jgi:CubicO group peptidase (beta-lactamase class C family)
MQKLLFLFFLPFVLHAKGQTPDVKPLADYNFGTLETTIETARKTWNVPGLAVGIIYKGEIVFAKGFGTCTEEKNEPVNENTNYGIASNTKAFTAMSIAMLVQDGKLKFEDKVIDHLPWFAAYNDYVTKEMTIRDLLTHHSGLETFSGDLIWYGSNYSRKEVVEHSRYLTPKYGFREKFGYSNIHFLTAGLVIEQVSGMTYDDFVRTHIFEPLGMKGTNTSIKNNPKTNVASPHAQRDGKNIPIPYVDWDNIAPAGSINSNVNDMLKWINTLVHKGKYAGGQLVSEATFAKLIQPVTPSVLSNFSQKMHPSKHLSAYGMGLNVFDYHGALVVNHAGGLDGMISHTAFVPEKDFGLVILCNAGVGLPGVLLYDVLDFMMHEKDMMYYAQYGKIITDNNAIEQKETKEKWADAKPGVKPPFDAEVYAGKYSGKVYGSATVESKKGKLYFKLDQTPMFNAELNYWKDDLFYFDFKEVPSLPRGTVKFVVDKDSKLVTQMMIDCPNPDFDFKELDLIREKK